MSMTYIRKTYSVPAKRGGRVEYTGNGKPQFGTIRATDGAHLMLRDRSTISMPASVREWTVNRRRP